jgi:hypothetical protein
MRRLQSVHVKTGMYGGYVELIATRDSYTESSSIYFVSAS